jgi:exodeoxyribonuclease-3
LSDGGGHYSWWTFRAGARAKNVGWRIDYWLASERLRPAVKRAFILPSITGSDHCPVGIEFDPA